MSSQPETIAVCDSCAAPMDVSLLAPFTNVECSQCDGHMRVKREFGPYTLVRRHAIGGMSMVFQARDHTLDREVALKILSEEYSADERRIAAFEQEARLTASFSHPNVVRVFTTGRAFGRFYIAMEFVPGGHFEHQIRARGKIPELELLPLAIEVAHGLKAAHSAGLIHRDVKPGNILLDAEGHAKLVDFGLALVTQGGKAQATELWATPYYVPPESVEGFTEDFRSDIYALGATLYHALCGKPSCGEDRMATDILREAKKKVIPLSEAGPEISEGTCRIVERAMAYDLNDRFGSYDEMISALTDSISLLKSGRAESTASLAKRRAEKKRGELKTVIAGAVVVLAVAIVAAVGLWWRSPAKTEPVAVAAPPVAAGGTSAGPDVSVGIARNYREARASVERKDYPDASVRFHALFKNPAMQEPSRTWAGLEAVLARFLDGQADKALIQSRETLDHMRALPDVAQGIGGGLPGILGQLGGLPPVSLVAGSGGSGASGVVAAMLAGLKNWEQGMLEPAAACFQVAASAKLPTDDAWAVVYQKVAADYLSDYKALTGPLFRELPADKAGCEAVTKGLDELQRTLRTRGRARFNVRAWQQDLARHARLLDAPGKAAPPELSDVLARLSGFSSGCRFEQAVGYLKSLSADPRGASRSSLLAMAESAAEFLVTIERDLAMQPADADLQLKSGEMMVKVSVDAQGRITATSAEGRSRTCKWSDFPPDALIALHRVLVKKSKSEVERLHRHECAIAFDWLAGNRERALAAAAVLSQSSPVFGQRWKSIAAGLPM